MLLPDYSAYHSHSRPLLSPVLYSLRNISFSFLTYLHIQRNNQGIELTVTVGFVFYIINTRALQIISVGCIIW
mgnify:CR=1 FL=1